MPNPSTALLVPCYNAERYLENLRKQVDKLDPAFDELVIVDDGSTDGTVEKARTLGFDIIPLGANRGPGAARNAAASRAKAEWIHFLDADDEIAPDYLAKVLPMVSNGVDVVLCSCDYIDEETGHLMLRWRYADESLRSDAVKSCLKTGVISIVSLIRRKVFDEVGGFDEVHRCWEDADMHFRMAVAGARFCSVSDVLCRALRHHRGASGSKLYCHRCRLDFLKAYAQMVPRVSAQELVEEAVLTATRLFMEGDVKNCDKALDLAAILGWRGPESKHRAMAALSRIPSRRWRKLLFRLQMRARGAHCSEGR